MEWGEQGGRMGAAEREGGRGMGGYGTGDDEGRRQGGSK